MTYKPASWPWSRWILGIDLVFILATILVPYLPPAVGNSFLHHFDLAVEMNLGAWWSALNLLGLALLAYELHSTSDRSNPGRWAWLILALIFAGLSMDEIGSFHERISDSSSSLPFIFLGGLFLFVALGMLYRNKSTRKTSVVLLTGFALFGFVAIQEYIEHIVRWPPWAFGLRVGVEEGTELFSMFLMLSALLRERRLSFAERNLSAVIANPGQLKQLPGVLFTGLLAHSLISIFIVPKFDISYRGNPAVWYPLSVFFLLFSSMLWQYIRDPKKRYLWLGLGVYFLLSSAAAVYLVSPRRADSRFLSMGFLSNFAALYLIQLVVIALLYWRVYRVFGSKQIAIFLFILLSLAVAFFNKNLPYQFTISGFFAYGIAGLFLHSERQGMIFRFLKTTPSA